MDLDLKRDGALRAQLRGGTLRAQLAAATRELEALREENARLQIDASRPRSLRKVGNETESAGSTVLGLIADKYEIDDEACEDDLDEAWHRLAEVRVMRAAVASALSELQVVCGQLLSRLELEAGATELDQKASERRYTALRSLGKSEMPIRSKS